MQLCLACSRGDSQHLRGLIVAIAIYRVQNEYVSCALRQPVYCLGLCACAPAAMVDGKVIGRVTEDRMTRILQEAGA